MRKKDVYACIKTDFFEDKSVGTQCRLKNKVCVYPAGREPPFEGSL